MMLILSLNFRAVFYIMKFIFKEFKKDVTGLLEPYYLGVFQKRKLLKQTHTKLTFFMAFCLLGFFYSEKVVAETPVIPLPEFPSGSALEMYEDSDELYALKLIEYYKIATVYQTQLMIIGDTNKLVVNQPSLEEITDNDTKILKQYYYQAKKLGDLLQKLPETSKSRQLDSLKLVIKDRQVKNDSLKIYSDGYALLKSRLDENINNIENLAKKLEDISYQYEMQRLENVKNIISREKIFLENQKVYSKFRNDVMLLDLSGNIISNFSPYVKNHLSGGLGLSFNTGYLFNLNDFIHLDLGFMNYRNTIADSALSIKDNSYDFENNIYNIGLSFTQRNLSSFNGLDLGITGGFSHFWTTLKARNTNFRNVEVDGQMLSLDVNLRNETTLIPYELYLGVKWYLLQDSYLIERIGSRVLYDFGEKTLVRYNLGIRIPIWRQISYTNN